MSVVSSTFYINKIVVTRKLTKLNFIKSQILNTRLIVANLRPKGSFVIPLHKWNRLLIVTCTISVIGDYGHQMCNQDGRSDSKTYQ